MVYLSDNPQGDLTPKWQGPLKIILLTPTAAKLEKVTSWVDPLVSILLGVKLRYSQFSFLLFSLHHIHWNLAIVLFHLHHGFAAWTPKDNDMERLQLSYVLFCLSI